MDKIVERLIENRNKRLHEATGFSEYIKKIEDILNHQLGSYEDHISVDDIELVSQTTENITFKVEYSVSIRIPMQGSEDGVIYYDDDTEYRTRTLTVDRKELE